MNNWAESFKTIYQDTIGGHFTLEEQRFKKISQLKKQPPQMALIVQPDYAIIPFCVADVHPPFVSERRRTRFVEQRFESIPFVTQDHKILEQIEKRTLELKQQAGMLPGNTEDEEEFDVYS